MPFYNREMYLNDAIESILNQTYADFEFIIIDDGSTQPVKELLNGYREKDSRIKILSNETNQGISSSRNMGNRAAVGQYIANMDADDISLPDRFDKQVEYLDQHPEIAVLGAQIIAIDGNHKEIWRTSYPLSPGLVRWGLIFNNQLNNPAVMMRRELLSDSGFQYGTGIIAHDYALWINISRRYKLANLPAYLLLYRVHGNNISLRKKSIRFQEDFTIKSDQITGLTGVNLSENLIDGMVSSKRIGNIRDAVTLSDVIVKLEKNTSQWDITQKEKKEIRKMASFKLRSIWHSQGISPGKFRLLPYLLYAFFLYLPA